MARMSKPVVFISYSHKQTKLKDRLVTHLRVLQIEGILEDVWDDSRIGAGEDWLPAIEQAMAQAQVAILLISADFLTSKFILSEEVPRLLEHREKEGLRVFPVIALACGWRRVSWLEKMLVRPQDGRPIPGGTKREAALAAIAEEIASITVQTRKGHTTLSPEKISLARLPSINPDLFGREDDLAQLDAAWESETTNIVSLVAFGGVGKSALVNAWLNRMHADNYRGAHLVYGWSFYSQGAAPDRQASADPFIAWALAEFGDPDPNKGSPWEKGERLAGLIAARRTLLILDGLEPLQHPPGEMTGRLQDPGMASLLRSLARSNHGLCIVTTRLDVADLQDFAGSTARNIALDELSPQAGAAYLKHLGVEGAPVELEQAARDFDGHALALTLLGRYLVTVYHGDVRRRDQIARLAAERTQGGHARRVMASYEKWFQGKPELAVLRAMGLFDRPAPKGAIDALQGVPGLLNLSHEDFQFAVASLREARLLDPSDPHDPDTLDCHPLVREHFAERLKETDPAAWKAGHSRLYEYYKTLPKKDLPDTLEEMAPLYAAVGHGCRAGRHQEVLDEVYSRRIQRRGEFFSTSKLGAFGSDLAALAGFFDPPWMMPVAALSDAAKAFVLGWAGFELLAVGRVAEAIGPMQASLEARLAQKDWENAARAATNLCQLHLTLGDLKQASAFAQQSVELADRSHAAFLRMGNRAGLADALYQAGRRAEAEALFREAEELQKQRQPEHPLLYSLQGFLYCDLLLGQGKYREVQDRTGQTLELVKSAKLLRDIGLDHLSLGRAHLLQVQQHGAGDLTPAATHLDQAVEFLRKSGEQDHLPRGLLARAGLHRLRRDFDHARADLDEALDIATRGGMKLHEADGRLESARLHLALGEKDQARESLAQAKTIIEATGYHRRDRDVTEIESQL